MTPAERARLVALLAAHVPGDEEEARDLETMLRYAGSLAEPFSRDEPEAHFTGSALVADPAGERTLLVHHAKSGAWFQPGGHFELNPDPAPAKPAPPLLAGSVEPTPGDASPAAAALREAREETGLDVRLANETLLDVDVHWIPWDRHHHLDLRYLVVAEGRPALAAAEVRAAEWLTWDEAFARIEETALRRALAKARAALAG